MRNCPINNQLVIELYEDCVRKVTAVLQYLIASSSSFMNVLESIVFVVINSQERDRGWLWVASGHLSLRLTWYHFIVLSFELNCRSVFLMILKPTIYPSALPPIYPSTLPTIYPSALPTIYPPALSSQCSDPFTDICYQKEKCVPLSN